MTGPTRAGDKSTRPRYGVTLLRWGTGFAGGHGWVDNDLSRGEAHNYSMEVRSDPFESAKSHFFDTSSWGEFCDVTLTLKPGLQPDRGGWVKIDDYRCRQAFRHFMNLLNRAVTRAAAPFSVAPCRAAELTLRFVLFQNRESGCGERDCEVV